jgi:hypothetical protein
LGTCAFKPRRRSSRRSEETVELSLPKTRSGWIALGFGVAVLAVVLYVTGVLKGHAVEISVMNGGPAEIFATIDNTGRHGEGTTVVRVRTATGKTTSPGIVIAAGLTKSFGMAVGFFDSPTLHVWRMTADGRADDAVVSDCAFDTIDYNQLKEWKLPSLHVTLKWTGAACQRVS